MVICFLTTDDILGSAGLKDMTKDVRSVFVVQSVPVTGVLRDVA